MTEALRQISSGEQPTLKRDGYEVRLFPLGEKPRIDGMEIIYIGSANINVLEQDMRRGLHRFLILDPDRAESFTATVIKGKDRAIMNDLLALGGFRQFTPDSDIHVVAARPKPEALLRQTS